MLISSARRFTQSTSIVPERLGDASTRDEHLALLAVLRKHGDDELRRGLEGLEPLVLPLIGKHRTEWWEALRGI